jgi:N-acetylmuramoyl-L-alanine amidase
MTLIVIDPGHGGPDPGACGFGLQEKAVALSISKLLSVELGKLGYTAPLTRDRDPADELELQSRCAFANDKWADLFVSIHCNAAENPSAHGTETYHFPGSRLGELLATAIQNAITSFCEISMDRGVKDANFQVLRNTDMPAALVEVAFISNGNDAACLGSIRWQGQVARAIAAGINTYLKGS